MNINVRKVLIICVLLAFMANTFGPMPIAQANEFRLPTPGVMVYLSPKFNPPILKGIKVYPDNPFRFDFILDKGDSLLSSDALKDESSKLIKYFLASLTIPEKDLWVNLSPYEKDRIIPNSFGLTEMGRDLLAEDYMLKQITASLIYPEDEIGKKFWKRIYEEAQKKFGTTNIPVNTFNKVWIVPEKAVVYENAKVGAAYVVESKLKVMLEQDYLSLEKHEGIRSVQAQIKDTNQLGSQIVREIVIPELTKEVNENKNFARLRQVYNSLILATWYKKKIKDSILEQVYADKNKVVGVNIDDPKEKERIYQRYLQAFKKGVYNYIKEDIDPLTQETMPRKYFSGGECFSAAYLTQAMTVVETVKLALLNSQHHLAVISSQFNMVKTGAILTAAAVVVGLGALAVFKKTKSSLPPITPEVLEQIQGIDNILERVQNADVKEVKLIIDEAEQKYKAMGPVTFVERKGLEGAMEVIGNPILRMGVTLKVLRRENNIELKAKEAAIRNKRSFLEIKDHLLGEKDFLNLRLAGHQTGFKGLYEIIFETNGLIAKGSLFNNHEGQTNATRLWVTRGGVKYFGGVVRLVFDREVLEKSGIYLDDKHIDSMVAVQEIPLRFLMKESKRHVWDAIQNYCDAIGKPLNKSRKNRVIAVLGYHSERELKDDLGIDSATGGGGKASLDEAMNAQFKENPLRVTSPRALDRLLLLAKEHRVIFIDSLGQSGKSTMFLDELSLPQPRISYLDAYVSSRFDDFKRKLSKVLKIDFTNSDELLLEEIKAKLSNKVLVIDEFARVYPRDEFVEFLNKLSARYEVPVILVLPTGFGFMNSIDESFKSVIPTYTHIPLTLPSYDEYEDILERMLAKEAKIYKRLDNVQDDLFNQIKQLFMSKASIFYELTGGHAGLTKEIFNYTLGGDSIFKDSLRKHSDVLEDFRNFINGIHNARDYLNWEEAWKLSKNIIGGGGTGVFAFAFRNYDGKLDHNLLEFKVFGRFLNPVSIENISSWPPDEIGAVQSLISRGLLEIEGDQIKKRINYFQDKDWQGLFGITPKPPDDAMASTLPTTQNNREGGIDLTPANMHLQTQNSGSEIKFHVDSAMLAKLQNAPGFVPVIIDIQPLKSLSNFLGLNQDPASKFDQTALAKA